MFVLHSRTENATARDAKVFAKCTRETDGEQMKPEERDAVIEECAKVCDDIARSEACYADRVEYVAEECATAIRALTAQSPAGVPPEPPTDVWGHSWTSTTTDGLGNKGIVWHNPAPNAAAPSVVTSGYSVVIGPAGVPTTEPVAAEPSLARQAVAKQVKAEMQEVSAALKRHRQAPAEPVAPIARDWMSRNVNEFASHFLRQYDKTTSVRESMMYAFVQTYDAPQAPVEPVAQEPEDERLSRLEAMAEDDGETWDLSTNDRAALAWAVETIKRASPISLPVEVDMTREPMPQCGIFCEAAERDMNRSDTPPVAAAVPESTDAASGRNDAGQMER
jgi:hypothetical protein